MTTRRKRPAKEISAEAETVPCPEQGRRFWLLKTDPPFDVAYLEARPAHTMQWDGIRNYEARNTLRDAVRPGDRALFYMSGVKAPAGLAVVEFDGPCRPDPTACDAASPYRDAKALAGGPNVWVCRDIRLVRALAAPLTAPTIKALAVQSLADVFPGAKCDKAAADAEESALWDAPAPLRDLAMLRRGRLSVSPVSAAEWATLMTAARALEKPAP